MFLGPLPSKKKKKKKLCLSSPNPFFSAVRPHISTNKRYQQVWEWEWVDVDGLKSTCTQRGLHNAGARLTLVANLNELETSFFVSSSLSLFFFDHSTNKLQFLLVHGADLRVSWGSLRVWLWRRSPAALGIRQMRGPDRQLLARYVLYTHLGLVRGNGGIYDVIKKCQERSAWEQVVSGPGAIKDSCGFRSHPPPLLTTLHWGPI